MCEAHAPLALDPHALRAQDDKTVGCLKPELRHSQQFLKIMNIGAALLETFVGQNHLLHGNIGFNTIQHSFRQRCLHARDG